LTLTQYDGGTFAPTFDDLQGIVAADTASMLTNYLRSGVAASTYQTILTNPVTGTGISSFLPRFTGTSTLDSTRLFYSSGRLGINMDASEAASHLTSRFVIRDFGHNFKFDGSAAGSGYTTIFSHDDTGLKIGQSSNIRDIRFTLNGTSGLTIANNSNSPARAVGIGNDSPSHQLDVTGTFRATGATTLGSTLAVTGNITESGNNVLTNLDTASLSSRIDLKLNKTDTASLSSRIDLKLNKTDTASLSTRINGKVSLTGDEYINGQKTFGGLIIPSNGMQLTATGSNSNKLIGINASSFVGEVTLGTGLTLTSNVLNANDNANSSLFISRTGTTVEFVEDLTIYSVIYLKLNNNSTITVTLPTASLNTNKSITIKNIGSGAVNSNASNVEPLNSSSLSSVLLVSGGGKFTTVVSDGTNWIKMAGN
jgi:hypothetical protein